MTMRYNGPVSQKELQAIFRSSIDRSIFISEYSHFDADGNVAYYKNFIDRYIPSTKYKFQEDAIELSIATNIFKGLYLDTITAISYSRRNEWIKLLCFDWLFHFFKEVPGDIFLQLNKFGLEKNKGELIKAQCLLNLFLLDDNYPVVENLTSYLNNNNQPTIFYRIVNGFSTIKETKNIKNGIIEGIVNLIHSSTILSKDQKSELVELLKEE